MVIHLLVIGEVGVLQLHRVTYSTDTTAAVPGANLVTGRNRMGAAGARSEGMTFFKAAATPTLSSSIPGSVPNAGYFGGGVLAPGTRVSTMDKCDFTTDTTTQIPAAAISTVRGYLAASSSTTAGYFAGGQIPSPTQRYSTVDKCTYSADTTARVPGANLSLARSSFAGTGTSVAGYLGGGNNAPFYSTMDKITYSSDTTAAIPGAALYIARNALAATGNDIAGYFGGGAPAPGTYTSVDKCTYSVDTSARIPSADLPVGSNAFTAIGNATKGYFSGGSAPGPTYYSHNQKITFSTDTTSLTPSAHLSSTRYNHSSAGNGNSGYFGGGNGASVVSTMDKLDYLSETTSKIPSGQFSSERYALAGSSGRADAVGNVSNNL